MSCNRASDLAWPGHGLAEQKLPLCKGVPLCATGCRLLLCTQAVEERFDELVDDLLTTAPIGIESSWQVLDATNSAQATVLCMFCRLCQPGDICWCIGAHGCHLCLPMRVGAGMPDCGVDAPGLGLVREPVSDAVEFFVPLEAALALVWHSWDDGAGQAAALPVDGCVPLEANLLDKGPQDGQDEVMGLCDCALGSLLAAQDMAEELLHT